VICFVGYRFPLALEDGETITEETLKTFIEAYTSGDLKPFFKSADVPEANDDPVVIVVGKNFDDVVLNGEADVLLEIYAPWCGHCKKLAPVWEELAKHFYDQEEDKSARKVVIAKMDGTENEVEGLSAGGFPTLKFFPASAKTVTDAVDYQGGRELDAFIEYIEKKTGGKKSSSKESSEHEDL